MAGMTLAPSPLNIYRTLRSLVEDGGYKIAWSSFRYNEPEPLHRRIFEQHKISHLLNTTFVNSTEYSEGIAKPVDFSTRREFHVITKSLELAAKYHGLEKCHVVEEQFGHVAHSEISLGGMLRDEMFRWAQFLVQHGFLHLAG